MVFVSATLNQTCSNICRHVCSEEYNPSPERKAGFKLEKFFLCFANMKRAVYKLD